MNKEKGTFDGQELFHELLEELKLKPSQPTFKRLAKDLSRIAGRRKRWSWKHLDNVARGRYPSSKVLTRTLLAALANVDDLPALLGSAVPVQVLTFPEDASRVEGMWVEFNPVRQCRQCLLWFSPRSPVRLDCPSCSPPRPSS